MSKFKPMSLLVGIVILVCGGAQGLMPLLAQSDACPTPDDLPPQLSVGLWGRVASGRTHNLRADAMIQAVVVAQVPDGDIFRVEDGPRCGDGYVWWGVHYAGTSGWMAEGDADTDQYWLAALEGQASPEATPDPDDSPDVPGCQKPPEDYGRALVNGTQLNARTLAMLDHAQALYGAEGGIINLRTAIMQGSYNAGGVAASFGTHDGGGAIDLSVRDRQDRRILTAEIEPLLRALRTAGFAAWLRDTDSLYPASPIHIHAIAIGDADLSEAARDQIDGQYGYLRGYDGLPREDGIPQPDTSGEMVLCRWMIDMGLEDLR